MINCELLFYTNSFALTLKLAQHALLPEPVSRDGLARDGAGQADPRDGSVREAGERSQNPWISRTAADDNDDVA